MMPGGAGLLVVLLVGLPFATWPSGVLALLAGPSVALCALGLAFRSVPVLTAGLVVAAMEYALALMVSQAPPAIPSAALFGLVLLLLLEVADVMGRTRGMVVDASVMRVMVRHWLAVLGAGAALMVVVVAGASALRPALASVPSPVLTGVGALGALLAAWGGLNLVTGSDPTPGEEDSHAPLA
jgi:hypothetical protein